MCGLKPEVPDAVTVYCFTVFITLIIVVWRNSLPAIKTLRTYYRMELPTELTLILWYREESGGESVLVSASIKQGR
jgi:hypothetical protein